MKNTKTSVIKNTQNIPFNIHDTFVSKPLSKMNSVELKNYLDIMSKYSPFFQKDSLDKGVKSKEIIENLAFLKIDSFVNYIPLSVKMNVYISIASNISTRIEAKDDQYQEISSYLFSDAINDPMIKAHLGDKESIINKEMKNYKGSRAIDRDVEKFLKDNDIENNSKNIKIAKHMMINKYHAKLSRDEISRLISKNFEKIVEKANKTRETKAYPFPKIGFKNL